MDQSTKEYLRTIAKDLWYYSSLSFSIAISIVLGTAIGFWADTAFGWSPVGTLVGLFLGICAGFRNIYIAMQKARRSG